MTRRLLNGAETVPNWTSIAGALHGIVRFLGSSVDQAHVMGTSGHAFRLAIAASDEGIPSALSPLSFDVERAVALYSGLGFSWESIGVHSESKDYARQRQHAIERIRRTIDRGRPAAVYGLHLREFGIVNGYDDRAGVLLVSTSLSTQFGTTLPLSRWPAPDQTGWIQAFLPGGRISTGTAASLRAAIEFAVAYARSGDPNGPSGTAHGFEAYERWLAAYEEIRLDAAGNARCIQTLQAARQDAARYLRTAAAAQSDSVRELLREAADSYQAEALALSRLSTLFPYPSGGDTTNRAATAAACGALREALGCEREAIDRLGKVMVSLGPAR
jgi:hypothetical protein